MKKPLIAIALVVLLLLGVTVWLASSVGPDTAPSDVKTIELDIDAR